MFQLLSPTKINNLFQPLSVRTPKGVYFLRFDSFSASVQTFVGQSYEAALKHGMIAETPIPEPLPIHMQYFTTTMGNAFSLNRPFLEERLKHWLPRLTENQRQLTTDALFFVLQILQRQSRNETIVKNAYSKYMCWLYYRFDRLISQLTQNEVPKLLCIGSVSFYEFYFLLFCSFCGADIVLLEPEGDRSYQQFDPRSTYSHLCTDKSRVPFPEGFGVRWIQKNLITPGNQAVLRMNHSTDVPAAPSAASTVPAASAVRRPQTVQPPLRKTPQPPKAPVPSGPVWQAHTNVWMKKAELDEALLSPALRGHEKDSFYNLFLLQSGAEDNLIYSHQLLRFYQQIQREKRQVVVINHRIPPPTPEEIAAIRRKNRYETVPAMLSDLTAQNMPRLQNSALTRLILQSFVEIMLAESDRLHNHIQKILNKSVYLLCWLIRYQPQLLKNWNSPAIGVFIFYGAVSQENDALFLRFLARLPVDVIVFSPNLAEQTKLHDPHLLELHGEISAELENFPVTAGQIKIRTAAYQAERELDTILYQDTGLYRQQQYTKATVLTLQPILEEIFILWDEEVQYRTSFSTAGETVYLPVLLEKICGVKNGSPAEYWTDIRKLLTPDTILVRSLPFLTNAPGPMQSQVSRFLQNGRLLREQIKAHPAYPYGILRDEMQDYFFDKLQLLLDQRLLVGTFETGVEYTIVATALNLKKDILRLLQRFDFTKKNPKLVIINTGEKILSLQESIMVALLHLLGFDIAVFVPTGYQCIEKYFTQPLFNEQQAGSYLYDLTVPDFTTIPSGDRFSIKTLRQRIFGRENR